MSADDRLLKADSIGEFLRQWIEGDYLDGEERETFRRYYASYVKHFGPYIKFHYGAQTRELFTDLAQDRSKRILEVGCGCGTESLWLSMHGYKVKGIDITEDLLHVARARKRVLETKLGRELPCEFERRSLLDESGRQYDVIWMEQAFHHLEPRTDVACKLSELLRPGGTLVIAETNAWNPAIQAFLFRLRGFKTVIQNEGACWGNERILTAGSLSRLLAQHGIKRQRVRYFRLFPNKQWADRLASRFGMVDDRDFGVLRPLYTHYNYVGVKR